MLVALAAAAALFPSAMTRILGRPAARLQQHPRGGMVGRVTQASLEYCFVGANPLHAAAKGSGWAVVLGFFK